MKLAVLMKDTEYRDALIERISSYDNDIFVTIADGSSKDTSDCLILTDADPLKVDSKVLSAIKDRSVFLTTSVESMPDGICSVFKFSSVPVIISELSIAYDSWHGLSHGIDHTARFITVCSESDAYSAEYCRSLARHIIYRRGGRILILPLSYINDYGSYDNGNMNMLSRLLYSIRSGRDWGAGSYSYTDSYGVSCLLIKPGLNPVSYLNEDELLLLVAGLSKCFDIVIGDISTCFRKENLMLLDLSEHTVFFERGRRDTGFEELIKSNELTRVKISGGPEDAAAIDDCVSDIFGMDKNETLKS